LVTCQTARSPARRARSRISPPDGRRWTTGGARSGARRRARQQQLLAAPAG
jgi:hypothetical protein